MTSAEQIYQEIIAPIEDRMIRTVAGIVGNSDDASDAFQEALITIWKLLPRIAQHPNPQGYVMRVCISASYDLLRKRARRQRWTTLTLSGVLGTTRPETDNIYASEVERQVMEAIARLPRQQAQAVLLQVVEDQPFEQMAVALGCSEATARSHVSKGKARLRKLLAHLHPNEKRQGK